MVCPDRLLELDPGPYDGRRWPEPREHDVQDECRQRKIACAVATFLNRGGFSEKGLFELQRVDGSIENVEDVRIRVGVHLDRGSRHQLKLMLRARSVGRTTQPVEAAFQIR
jgi:hypothetical protein